MGSTSLGTDRELSKEERIILFSEMDLHEKMTFAKVRSVLNLPRNSRFNLENGDRKALVGNITACRIREAIGETWEAMAEGSRSQMLEDLLTIENAQALAKRGETHWKFDRVAAEHFSEIELEEDYSAFSRHAMRRLLPLLEFGKSITEAILELDPNHGTPPTAMDELPPCENLRNPIVQRTLAELRRIINHLIAVHGKPEAIRIELARDLKQGSKQREESYKRMRLRERNNAAAKARVLTELGGSEVKAWQIERVLLADECQWHCPYTGQPISMAKLLSNESSFDVEHIIPFSRSLDDSFANKTLCLAEENRNRKGNRTPFEAYSSNADSWAAMIGRVEHFQSDYAEEKLRRFLLRDVPGESSFIEDFSSAQLNDTRYMSKKAAEYVGHLYGADFRKHVQVTKGQVTAYLRSAWSLNEILSKSGRKSRDDHRHHAVDAIAVALTTPEMIRKLSEISSGQSRARRFPGMPDPWSGFGSDVRQSIEKMIVSHRVERRVNGQLHKETFYGIIRSREDNKEHAVVRRRIEMLTDKEIKENAIVDPSVRKAVETKLGELNLPPAKAFQERVNHPHMPSRDGRNIPIHSVRVFQDVHPETIGGTRQVQLRNNHHLEIFSKTDRNGKKMWRERIVSLLDAKHRLREHRPIIAKADEDGNPLIFSLAIGEAVELTLKGQKHLCVVQKITDSDYFFKFHNDARLDKERSKDKIRISGPNSLMKTNCQKVVVTPTGLIRYAND